jgi:hypothetical protein
MESHLASLQEDAGAQYACLAHLPACITWPPQPWHLLHPAHPGPLSLAVNTLSAGTACASLYCLQDDYIDDTMDAENYESSFEEWGAS